MQFKVNQVVVDCTYKAHGSLLDAETVILWYSTNTPYGAYTNPTFRQVHIHFILHVYPRWARLKKTYWWAFLRRAKTKQNGKLDYKAVTQVVVSPTPSQCNVPAVTQLVSQQIGFAVQLLESKYFALLANEGTAGEDFWNIARKVLAASKSLYGSVGGLSVDMSIEQAIDLTDDKPGPSQKGSALIMSLWIVIHKECSWFLKSWLRSSRS